MRVAYQQLFTAYASHIITLLLNPFKQSKQCCLSVQQVNKDLDKSYRFMASGISVLLSAGLMVKSYSKHTS